MTEKFTISDQFQSPERDVIREAAKLCHLDEGISFVSPEEAGITPRPFIVIINKGQEDNYLQLLKHGALDIIKLTPNSDDMARAFNRASLRNNAFDEFE